MADIDTVVIGSGAGGLVAALALAQAGQKVLILEQHYLPGGWCHSFPLGGHLYSPGVHYVGELGPGGRMRELLEGLGVSGELVFCELNPEGYDHVQVGTARFDYPKGRERLIEALSSRFPREAKGIRACYDAMDDASAGLIALNKARSALEKASVFLEHPTGAWWATASLGRLLERHVKDPLARAFMAAQAGNYGLPPRRSVVVLHAGVAGHYYEGGWYPMGGGRAIPRAFLHALRRAGGDIRVRAPVTHIQTEACTTGRRVVAVRLASGEEIACKAVVSNADPEITLRRLVGEQHLDADLRRRLDRAKWSLSCLSLFLAAEFDPAEYGLDSGNNWIYAHPDLDAIYGLPQGLTLDEMAEIPAFFLTVTSLKDPTKRKGNVHTMEMFTLVPWGPFADWGDTTAEHRPASYQEAKRRLEAHMLAALERRLPGIRDRITFSALGTPITNLHYVAATGGNMYGTERTLDQLGPRAFPFQTSIEGLYLCGAATGAHGVYGAMTTGLGAAARLLHVRRPELLRQQGPALRTVPADRPEAWPEDLRARLEAAEAV